MNGLKNDNEYSGLLKYAESRLSQIYDNSQRQDHQLALTQLIANAIKEQQDSAPKEVFDRLMEGVSKLEQRIAADHPEHDRSRSTVFGSALAFLVLIIKLDWRRRSRKRVMILMTNIRQRKIFNIPYRLILLFYNSLRAAPNVNFLNAIVA